MSEKEFEKSSSAVTPSEANSNFSPLQLMTPYLVFVGGTGGGGLGNYDGSEDKQSLKRLKCIVRNYDGSQKMLDLDTMSFYYGIDPHIQSDLLNSEEHSPSLTRGDQQCKQYTGLPVRLQRINFFGKDNQTGDTKEYSAFFLVSDPVSLDGTEEGPQDIFEKEASTWQDTTWIEDDEETQDSEDYAKRIILGGGSGGSFSNTVWVYGREKYVGVNDPTKLYVMADLINLTASQEVGPIPTPMPAGQRWKAKNDINGDWVVY